MNYIDVNVFIYWLTNDPDFGEIASKIIREIELGEKAFTSALTMWQLHILLEKETENYSEEILIEKMSRLKNLTIVPLTVRDFKDALVHQKEWGLDFEDSLHYAVADRLGAVLMYSNDSDFDNAYMERRFE